MQAFAAGKYDEEMRMNKLDLFSVCNGHNQQFGEKVTMAGGNLGQGDLQGIAACH